MDRRYQEPSIPPQVASRAWGGTLVSAPSPSHPHVLRVEIRRNLAVLGRLAALGAVSSPRQVLGQVLIEFDMYWS